MSNFNFTKGTSEYFSPLITEKKMNLSILTILAASINASFPFKSIVSALYGSDGLAVEASIIAVTFFSAIGNVSGKLKSPYINSAPHSLRK